MGCLNSTPIFELMGTHSKAYEEYVKMSAEDLEELQYTGVWEQDRKRFTSEYFKNQEVFNILDIDFIDDEYDYNF